MEQKEIDELLASARQIANRAPCDIEVGNKKYRVKQVSNKIRSKIADLEKEAYLLERNGEEEVSLREAKRIDGKLRTLHSKTAAYYLLGNWALFVPFLFAVKWRMLDLRDSEHTFKINESGMNNRGVDFFLANWQITKAQLALSTRLVGGGIKQYQERMESATNMLAKDALGKSKDSK